MNSRRAVSKSISILPFEALLQQLRAFVVQAAPAHVERLDLRWRRVADRLEIALADEKIILDHAAERREREHDLAVLRAVLEADVEDEAVLLEVPRISR